MGKLKVYNVDVSIIVPLFHGKEYVAQMVRQISDCAREVSDVGVELILYNDDPSEKIEDDLKRECRNLVIKVINATINLGIHGARVEGLKRSSGDLVVFLDQDDIINPNYLESQIHALDEGDMVVCRCIHNNKLHYTESFKFEEVVTPFFLMNRWNSIVSPGQVLLRRRIIPTIWMDNVLKINGADDYYLWLLLCGLQVEFKLNYSVLFEHTVRGDNISLDTNRMMDSEEEMISSLLESNLFDDIQKEKLIELRVSLRKAHIKELEDYREAFYCYENMMGEIDGEIKDHIVGIYGAGIIGRTVGTILYKYGIKFVYIDRNANSYTEANIVKPDEIPRDVEIITVTPLPGREDIVKELREKCSYKVYSLREFIEKYFKNC